MQGEELVERRLDQLLPRGDAPCRTGHQIGDEEEEEPQPRIRQSAFPRRVEMVGGPEQAITGVQDNDDREDQHRGNRNDEE